MTTHLPDKTSIHGPLLEQSIPDWLLQATPQRRQALKDWAVKWPDWYLNASPVQQQRLDNAFLQSFISQNRVDQLMSVVQDIDTFAQPLLNKALKDLGVEADINETFLSLRRPLAISDFDVELSSFEVLKVTLLQAALHNFEAGECTAGAFHKSSGFSAQKEPDTFEPVNLSISVDRFLTLCRDLDLGAQYQRYLKDLIRPTDIEAETRLRDAFVSSQKDALRAAAETALLKGDITQADYTMILTVVDGEKNPTVDGKPVWFRDLSLMKRRMTGCIWFGICEKYRYSDDVILYIPHDPEHPLKRYRGEQLRETLKRQFTNRKTGSSVNVEPTDYQRFFSRFVAYADRPYYFSRFRRKAVDSPRDPLHSPWLTVAQWIPLISDALRIKELPPERGARYEPDDDPYLSPLDANRLGEGIWADNPDLWHYLFERHRDKVLADARSHAVPTADADATARAKKLAHLLEIGLLAVNAVSMFVPVLGEIMLTVMAGQLLYEAFAGAIEWSEGDRQAAKAHLLDVAENLALTAVMAGAGKGLAKLSMAKLEPVVEALDPVVCADGRTRLAQPGLSAYEQDVELAEHLQPDVQGQYRIDDKRYIRMDGKVYQTVYDEALKKWRISHPDDARAWQPILEHNGEGAWRHVLERPLTWDRLKLLRRMGPVTYAFDDEQLLNAAQASGVEDSALRKMHMDRLPPPPELSDMLRLFEAGRVDDLAGPGNVSTDAQQGLIGVLKRTCPGLSERAARKLLVNADAREWAQLHATRRVPLRMLEEARWHARQGRFNHAFAGLYRDAVVSGDSQWLALRALEKLPGWRDDLRLEIRQGDRHGPLLDAIGSESASRRRYVVKNGPNYRAFDERGQVLGDVLTSPDSFCSSLSHALPAEVRTRLGLSPGTGVVGLRRKLIAHVSGERRALQLAFEQRNEPRMRIKPPVRVRDERLGYYASGRGQGLNPSLVTRVRDVYPNLTDELAQDWMLKLLRAGKNDAQIYELLQRRAREWQALVTTLDEWAGAPPEGTLLQSMIGGKASVARNLKECWRNAPLAEDFWQFTRLDLTCDDAIPALPADFSHVRELNIWGRCITDANADGLLDQFSSLSHLRINATGQQLGDVPLAVQNMRGLRELTLYSPHPFSPQMPSQLATLTSLEVLRVMSASHEPLRLDVTPLRNLRTLDIIAYAMWEVPEGVLTLPNLERLNLLDTGVNHLPQGFFDGHERLWRGLSVDWSKFERGSFKPAYEYVRRLPGNPVHGEEMLRDYCRGEVRRLVVGINEPAEMVINGFLEQWPETSQRYAAIEALSEQFSELEQHLDRWLSNSIQGNSHFQETLARASITNKLKSSWRKGIFRRFGSTTDCSLLDLSGTPLQALPSLPADAFPHVRILHLNGLKVPAEHLQGFVRGFSEVVALDLSDNNLGAVPFAPDSVGKLTHLNLSGNRIVSLTGQQALEGFANVQYLDLSDNPLRELDVSGMTALKALNLHATSLQEWPAGAHSLAHLTWLDLSATALKTLPDAALQGEILLDTDLSGTALEPHTRQAVTDARTRIEQTRGLPVGTLERFARQSAPGVFPPGESGSMIARLLLPLPERVTQEGAAGFVQRLQRLDPALTPERATSWIERLRETGLADEQISHRLAQHEQTLDTLVHRLNGWLFVRETHGPGWSISADSRCVAATRVLNCWREGVLAEPGVAEHSLTFEGLQIGDLPELPDGFSHVSVLDLTGIRLTADNADSYLKVFDRLERLSLSGNELTALPSAVQRMNTLERLDLSSNGLSDPHPVCAMLAGLERLNWLDMSYNDLETFDVNDLPALTSLDLHINNLTEWPEGVLERNTLRTLNLSGNDITSLPDEALDGDYDALIAGTDMSDNPNLSRESLLRIQAYRDAGGLLTVLGISPAELDEMIESSSTNGESETSSFESDEVLEDGPILAGQQKPWLENATPEQTAARASIWNQVAAEPGNTAFFHLLSRLQETREFQVANADLTRRVWGVMEAIAQNSELREVVFAAATSHGTCVDGRLLTFSGIESKVFVHNALSRWPDSRPMAKGRMLLDLSRQLFRLDRVDELAGRAAARGGHDEAEVRLGYRIGLTDGWSDGLILPGQPRNMTYSSGVTARQLTQARAEVVAAQNSDAFLIDLIQRDYWVDYLKERHPQAFSELDAAENAEDSEDEAQSADDPALIAKLFDLAAARNARMIELSRDEIEAIGRASPRPGPSTQA